MGRWNSAHYYLTLTLFQALLIFIHETTGILSPSKAQVGHNRIAVAVSGEALAQVDNAEQLQKSTDPGPTRNLLETLSQSKIAEHVVLPEAEEKEVDESPTHQPTFSDTNAGTISKAVPSQANLGDSDNSSSESDDFSLILARYDPDDTALRHSQTSSQIPSAFRATSSQQSSTSRISDQRLEHSFLPETSGDRHSVRPSTSEDGHSVHPSTSGDRIQATGKATSHQTDPPEQSGEREGLEKVPLPAEEVHRTPRVTSALEELPSSSSGNNMAADVNMMSVAGTSSRELTQGNHSAPNSNRSLWEIPRVHGFGRESQEPARIRRQSTENVGQDSRAHEERERASLESGVKSSLREVNMMTEIRKPVGLMSVVPVPRITSTDRETEAESPAAKVVAINPGKRKFLDLSEEPNGREGVGPYKALVGPERQLIRLETPKPVSQRTPKTPGVLIREDKNPNPDSQIKSSSKPFEKSTHTAYLADLTDVEIHLTLKAWNKVINSKGAGEDHLNDSYYHLIEKIFGTKSKSIRERIELNGFRKLSENQKMPWDAIHRDHEFMVIFAAALGYTNADDLISLTPEFCLEALRSFTLLENQSITNYNIAAFYFSTRLGADKYEKRYQDIIEGARLALDHYQRIMLRAIDLKDQIDSEDVRLAGFQAASFHGWIVSHFKALEYSPDPLAPQIRELAVQYVERVLREKLLAIASTSKNSKIMRELDLYRFLERANLPDRILEDAKERLKLNISVPTHIFQSTALADGVANILKIAKIFLTDPRFEEISTISFTNQEIYSNFTERILVIDRLVEISRDLPYHHPINAFFQNVRGFMGSVQYDHRIEDIQSKANEIKLFTEIAEYMGWMDAHTTGPNRQEAVKLQILVAKCYKKNPTIIQTVRTLSHRFYPEGYEAIWEELHLAALNQVHHQYAWLKQEVSKPRILTSEKRGLTFEDWKQGVYNLGPRCWSKLITSDDQHPPTRSMLSETLRPLTYQYEKFRVAQNWREAERFVNLSMKDDFRKNVNLLSRELQLGQPWVITPNQARSNSLNEPGLSLAGVLKDPKMNTAINLVMDIIGSSEFEARKNYLTLMEEKQNLAESIPSWLNNSILIDWQKEQLGLAAMLRLGQGLTHRLQEIWYNTHGLDSTKVDKQAMLMEHEAWEKQLRLSAEGRWYLNHDIKVNLEDRTPKP